MWLRRFILVYLVQKINTVDLFQMYEADLRKEEEIDLRKSLQRSETNVTLNLFSPPLICNHNYHYLNRESLLEIDSVMVYFHDFARDIERSYSITTAAAQITEKLRENNARSEHIQSYTWVLYVPGFNAAVENAHMKQAFMKLENSFYINIDHFALTGNEASFREGYESAVKHRNGIASGINYFLVEMAYRNIPVTSIRYIGHGVGAQILGSVGFSFQKLTGQRLKRITALDPAGPCFDGWPHRDIIRKGAADYVEIFHCNAGGLGTASFEGDVDFIANIGVEPFQPGCNILEFPGYRNVEEAAMCSHSKCVQFYSETVNNKTMFPAVMQVVHYDDPFIQDFARGDSIDERTIAGYWNPGKAKGTYNFSTQLL